MTRQEAFRRRAAEALANRRIRENLGRFGTAYRTARKNALAVLDYSAESARLRRMKEDAVERLPELAEQFVEAARQVGAHVYRARTAEDACRYIGQLAKERGVQLVVKSKSMVSEEIELNRKVEQMGIQHLDVASRELFDRHGKAAWGRWTLAPHLADEAMLRLVGSELRTDPDAVDRLC